MEQIARGLSHLHTTASLPHGNLTLSNVLMDSEGHVMLTDVGLRDVATGGLYPPHNSAAGKRPSPWVQVAYQPPEHAASMPASQAGDLFSAGCVYLELVSRVLMAERLNGVTVRCVVSPVLLCDICTLAASSRRLRRGICALDALVQLVS